MKLLDQVTWPKVALLGGVALLVLGIVHRPSAEWALSWIERLIGLMAAALGGG